jgi:hypothetical protein
MPRPHVHPSVSCYKKHRCRCEECRAMATAAQRRQRTRARDDNWVPAARRMSRPLDEDEVMRLRRQVGLIK